MPSERRRALLAPRLSGRRAAGGGAAAGVGADRGEAGPAGRSPPLARLGASAAHSRRRSPASACHAAAAAAGAPPPLRGAWRHVHQAGTVHRQQPHALPAGVRARVPAVPRHGASDGVGHRQVSPRGGAWPAGGVCLLSRRADAPRRRVDRAGARRDATHRRGRGDQGAEARGREVAAGGPRPAVRHQPRAPAARSRHVGAE
mmetsp:Transcript_28684/g.69899  ORF Transcript_28684/g.69899 Transcript_28684/m.69899 type:complete len:202 (+) Transcript_28684:140-745(+)